MDNPTEETKRISRRRGRADMKVGTIKHRKCHNYGVTRKQFHALIERASQPIKREAESDSGKSET